MGPVDIVFLFCFIASCCCISNDNAQPQIMESMEWKFSRKLYGYHSYGAITLERINIPIHTIFANITLNAFSTDSSCENKDVKVFAKQFGIPVVSRDGETLPDDSAAPTESHNVTMTTDNQTTVWTLKELQAGSVFIMAIFPNPDTKIRQKGLGTKCSYFITIQAKMRHFREESIPMLPLSEEFAIEASSNKILGFRLPEDTLSYSLDFEGCPIPCHVNVLVRDTISPDMWPAKKSDCLWNKDICHIQKSPARVNSINYISLSSKTPVSLKTKLQINICEEHDVWNATPPSYLSPKQDPQYRLVAVLNRETPSNENQGSNFYDRFAVMDRKTSLPLKIISISISDLFISVMRFKLWASDTGSSLNVFLHTPLVEGDQDAVVKICVSQYRILNSSSCSEGSVLTVDTRKKNNPAKLLFPYPESGVWYFSLQSSCFSKAANKSSNTSVACSHYPLVNMTVSMASCLEGKCSNHGACKLYTGADILYSACDCHSGWRGYGCNDGSRAFSDADEKLSVYLLTLSNLGFIPGIIIAFRRRFFVEGLVYTYNMFFSTFYHACDSSDVYKLCILSYDALSFADFFASLLSFAVTLLAMARLTPCIRSFIHMLMALFISLGEVYNRHGLVEQLLPIATGVAILVLTWGFECYRRKELFPSKKRYLKFILPGVLMAGMGLVLNLALSTQENYKYVHSVWHLLESLAIVFLLPPGSQRKDESNTALSVQSGDVAFPGEEINLVDEHGVGLRNAGDVSPQSQSSSSLRQTSSIRERFSRIVGPRRTRQNFVL